MKTIFLNFKLYIEKHSHFLKDQVARELFSKLQTQAPWNNPRITKSGTLYKKRNKLLYGEIPYYEITIRGQIIRTPVRPWEESEVGLILKSLRDMVATATGQSYNTCVLQLYNNGEVGIEPHRDKELLPETIIASISLGQTRIMRFEKEGFEILNIPLESGSLCLIHPPTNQTQGWVHSIPKDQSINPRLSIIFRLY